MGRRIVMLMVAVSVFYHTVVGCCAHHAHAQSPAGKAESLPGSVASSPVHRCCHGHSHRRSAKRLSGDRRGTLPNESNGHSSAPADDSAPCDEASCAFAVTKAATLPSDAVKWVPLSALATGLESLTALVSAAPSFATDGQRDVWWPEGLRAHLFLQNLRN